MNQSKIGKDILSVSNPVMNVAARPRCCLEPTPATTPSDLADELLLDFKLGITAAVSFLRPCSSLQRRVCVLQQPFSRPPVVN